MTCSRQTLSSISYRSGRVRDTSQRREKHHVLSDVVLALLAFVFTLALTFATLELPRIVNSVLVSYFADVPTDVLRRGFEPPSIGPFMALARLLGYASLAIVVVLVVVGFITQRRRLSFLGSFAFFIPTFGYFAASMFILAGVGILRVMWLPFWDSYPILMELGDVAYAPYWAVMYPSTVLLGAQQSNQIGNLLAYLIIMVGLLVFWFGTFAWFRGRINGRRILDFSIYKYSRHPQYLGFILWTYGVLLLATQAPNPFWVRQPEPSFPWLISTLLIICLALNEEVFMIRRFGKRYSRYRGEVPFMLPVPHFLSKILAAPNLSMLKRTLPENGKEVLYTFVTYFIVFALLSILILAFQAPVFELRF